MYDIFYTSTSRYDIKASTLATALNPSDPTYHRNARRQVGTSCHLCVDFRLWPKIGHGKHLGSTGINQFNPLPDPPAFHGEGKGWLSQVGFGLKILGKAVYSKFWKSKVQSLCKSKKTSLNRKNIYKSHAQLIDIFGELCQADLLGYCGKFCLESSLRYKIPFNLLTIAPPSTWNMISELWGTNVDEVNTGWTKRHS